MTRYVIGLSLHQDMEKAVRGFCDRSVPGAVPAPLEPMFPILETHDPPVAPVGGLLPVCLAPLVIGREAVRTRGGWWIWPVHAGAWPDDLARELGSLEGAREQDEGFFPLRQGVPLAICVPSGGGGGRGDGEETGMSMDTRAGWRALNLRCWEFSCSSRHEWYRAVAWRPLWHRRLKRAPGGAGNAGNRSRDVPPSGLH